MELKYGGPTKGQLPVWHRLSPAMGAVPHDSSPGKRAVPVSRLYGHKRLGLAPNIRGGCDCDCVLDSNTESSAAPAGQSVHQSRQDFMDMTPS